MKVNEADIEETEKALSKLSETDRMWASIARMALFEQDQEDVPEEADKFINDNYHVYGGAGHSDKRHLLEDLVIKQFGVDRLTASCWISATTT